MSELQRPLLHSGGSSFPSSSSTSSSSGAAGLSESANAVERKQKTPLVPSSGAADSRLLSVDKFQPTAALPAKSYLTFGNSPDEPVSKARFAHSEDIAPSSYSSSSSSSSVPSSTRFDSGSLLSCFGSSCQPVSHAQTCRDATRFDVMYAYFRLFRLLYTRVFLVTSVISLAVSSSNTDSPHSLALTCLSFIIVLELTLNNWLAFKNSEYFPSTVYCYLHTIRSRQVFSGYFQEETFDSFTKLRLLLLTIAVNVALSVASFQSFSSTGIVQLPEWIQEMLVFQIYVVILLEFGNMMLNNFFFLLVCVEIMWRNARYMLVLNARISLAMAHTCGFPESLRNFLNGWQMTDLSLWPLSFENHSPYPRKGKRGTTDASSDEALSASSIQTDAPSASSLASNGTEADGSGACCCWSLDTRLWGVDCFFFPCYAFCFKWIGL